MMGLYLRLIAVHVRGQLQYRASFLLDVLGTGLANVVYIATIGAVLTRFGTIGGWTFGETAFLYALVEIAFAVMDMVFTGFDPDTFSQQVRRGTLDLYLLRPLGLVLQVMTSEFALRRLGRIAQGVAVLAVALRLEPVVWTGAKLLYLPIVLLSTVAFYGGLFMIGSTICFWTVQNVEAINIFTYGGTEMMSYPMHIYGTWLRRFFTYVVPAALVVYYPTLYFLDKPDPLGMSAIMPFVSPLAGGAVLLAALAFWRVGVRRYTSTGT